MTLKKWYIYISNWWPATSWLGRGHSFFKLFFVLLSNAWSVTNISRRKLWDPCGGIARCCWNCVKLSLPLNVYLKCGLTFKRIEKLVTASQTEAKAVRFVIFLSLLGLKGLRTSSDFFNFAFLSKLRATVWSRALTCGFSFRYALSLWRVFI